MGFNFVTADREQGFLMPPDVRDWLPPDELAWFVIDAVDQMDLSQFRGRYRADGHGRPAYDPALMVGLLLFAYCDGERSSRVIERRCTRDVAYRVICGNRVPDHATIARFRAGHEQALAGIFGQVLRLCAQAGLVKVGLVAVDGTKLTADAASTANRTAEQLHAEIEQILREAARVDAAEDEQHGEARGDELPAGLADRKSRLAKLKQAKARLDAEDAALKAAQQVKIDRRVAARAAGTPIGGPDPSPQIPKRARRKPARINITDPDSRIMKGRHHLVQGYNAQLAVGGGQIILAAGITQCSNDSQALHPMITAASDHLTTIGHPAPVRCVLADAGYASETNFTTACGPILLVSVTAEQEQTRRAAPRPPQRTPRNPTRHAMRRRLNTPAGRNLYRRRSPMIEPVFGQLIARLGRRLPRRGLAAATSEWNLMTTSHNLLKLHRAETA